MTLNEGFIILSYLLFMAYCQRIPRNMFQLNNPIDGNPNQILLNGNQLSPIDVYHQPVYLSNKNIEETSSMSQEMTIKNLIELNKKLDSQLKQIKLDQQMNNSDDMQPPIEYNPNINQNISSNINQSKSFLRRGSSTSNSPSDNDVSFLEKNSKSVSSNGSNDIMQRQHILSNSNQSKNVNLQKAKLSGIETSLENTDFTKKIENTACVKKEGLLKVRDYDVKDKDVAVTYAYLNKERLSYFINPKDETSIQGSIELNKITESLKLINGFNSCFTIKTKDGVSDCSICAENEDSAREWINSITQNSVNCNSQLKINNDK